MGEQPGPIEDEVERALVSMRAGFLSGASQIVAEIGSLQEHLAGAPDRERDSVGAAIRQIVNVQARLTAQMETLPAAAWDRFKAMVNIVKAQQSVLDQLGNLMQKHVLPRQLKNLSRSPLPGLASLYSPELEDSGYDEPIPEPEPQDETLLRANAALQALDGGLNSTAQTPTARNSPDRFEDEEEEARSLFARARQRMASSLGLAVMAIAAVAIAAGARIMMQRDVKLEDVAAKVVAIV
ncbi:MAG: hypothetical protein J2P50_19350, partial [Hyphomicrobiaceae bacterium]|nr:hypothetical protein [Hyphomicrobiaceae bacterium]